MKEPESFHFDGHPDRESEGRGPDAAEENFPWLVWVFLVLCGMCGVLQIAFEAAGL